MSSNLNIDEVLALYNQGQSPYEIAEKLNTYPNKIRRMLKKVTKIRGKSEAQSKALSSGRKKHPTKGVLLSQEQKVILGNKAIDRWKNMSEEEYERRVAIGKTRWSNMDEKTKEKMREKSLVALRQSAKEGSKAENFIKNELPKHGFSVTYHKTGLIPNHQMEVDLFIPELKTVIEIDGPTHFFPIWGEQRLQKHIKADTEKAGLLLNHGYVLIRVKCLIKHFGIAHGNNLLEAILVELKKINENFPDKDNRYIEIEVT